MKDPVRSMCQEMWDTGLRVSPTTRTLDECARFDQDNVEFTVSLLDCRFLSGDAKLFERLHEKNLPQLVARESDVLMQRLAEVTRTRHLRFGDTIFHLEPNLKDGPGGLRDLHVSRWLETDHGACLRAQVAGHRSMRKPNSETDAVLDAMEFLTSSRCYLHYRGNRDENVISWEAQDELAKRGIATKSGSVSSAEWMRLYFRHAKTIHRHTRQMLDQLPRKRSSLYRSFQHWRSRSPTKSFRWWTDASICSRPRALAIPS